MTEAEKIEFTNLKYARAEQGFWTPEQQDRWNYLHQLHGQEFMKKMKILDERRLMSLN